MAKNGRATLDDLLVQLRIANRLLAAQLRGTMNQKDIIAILASVGATQQEIADVLDTSAGVVSVTLARLRKKRKQQVPDAE